MHVITTKANVDVNQIRSCQQRDHYVTTQVSGRRNKLSPKGICCCFWGWRPKSYFFLQKLAKASLLNVEKGMGIETIHHALLICWADYELKQYQEGVSQYI